MPILIMGVMALLVFVVIGVLCFSAIVAESKQSRKHADVEHEEHAQSIR